MYESYGGLEPIPLKVHLGNGFRMYVDWQVPGGINLINKTNWFSLLKEAERLPEETKRIQCPWIDKFEMIEITELDFTLTREEYNNAKNKGI